MRPGDFPVIFNPAAPPQSSPFGASCDGAISQPQLAFQPLAKDACALPHDHGGGGGGGGGPGRARDKAQHVLLALRRSSARSDGGGSSALSMRGALLPTML